jgi:DNA-directed RNA polymerase subunit K/omega
MDYKKLKAPTNTVTRDMNKLIEPVGNVYEVVRIIAKRSNQIAIDLKRELDKKLLDFASASDTMEEVFENHEQIEISRYYEKMPKPTLDAIEEFEEGRIYYRNPTNMEVDE